MSDQRPSIMVGCAESGLQTIPIDEHFAIAAKLGFRYLEFGIGGGLPGRLPDEPSVKDVKAFLKTAGRYAIQTPFCRLENDFTMSNLLAHMRSVELAVEQINAAADCGATQVSMLVGKTPFERMSDDSWRRMVEAFETCNTVCADLGLRIAVRTQGALSKKPDGSYSHASSAATNFEALDRMVDQLPPAIGFDYDPAAIKVAEPDCHDLHLPLLNHRVIACHLKDWKRSGDGWVSCSLGEGDLDYEPLLEQMRFDGVYLLEYDHPNDFENGLKRSINYLSRVCENVVFG